MDAVNGLQLFLSAMENVYTEGRINRINELVAQSSSILIVAHRSPDGDAVGSSLGLYNALKEEGKQVDVWMPDDFAPNLKWIPGNNILRLYDGAEKEGNEVIKSADLIFCLDFNTLARTGGMAQMLTQSEAPKVLIDHHLNPDDVFEVQLSDTSASSTCEMVFNFLTHSDRANTLTGDAARCLYVGLVTDTGSFKYAVSSETHHVASELIAAGVDSTELHGLIFDVNSGDRLQLLGFALSEKMVHVPEKKSAYIALSAEDLARFNYKKGYTEGLVNWGLSIEGVQMAILASEKDGCVKISFRSKGDKDVNVIAKEYFGGGGHKNAAGARSDKGYAPTVEILKEIIEKHG